MDYKLKNRDGVETTYTKDKIKIPAATGDSMVVFTQGEAQAEKTVDIAENGAFSVEPDAGYAFVKKVSGTVNVPTPEPDLQEKTVEITANGQTSVSPDAGKDGLSKVDITVAVPGTDFSQVTVTESDVLQGKAFLDAQGELKYGGILERSSRELETHRVDENVYLTWPAGYYPSGIHYDYSQGGYEVSFINTTYQSEDSKAALLAAAQAAMYPGQIVLGAPAWMIGIGFQIGSNWMFAINTIYVDQSSGSAHCVGGVDTGEASVRMELSGTIGTDNTVDYTLENLEYNGIDIKNIVSTSTNMRIVSLVVA